MTADPAFRAEQSAVSLTLTVPAQDGSASSYSVYPLDGRSVKYQKDGLDMNTAAKWEGAALLVNTIVSGPENYSITERWKKSNDGTMLTITRTVVRTTGETEWTLVYANAARIPAPMLRPEAARPQTLVPRAEPTGAPVAGADFVVPAGTHILLRLTNEIDTKHAKAGDHVYLETASPVFINGRMVIPVGSYVNGSVADSKRAGVVKGKSTLTLYYDSITLRSGIARDLRSRPDSAGSQGNLDKTEGTIDGGKNGVNAGRVAQTTVIGTGVGAGIGAAAGHIGAGAGIGAAGGALVGLAGALAKRNPDVVLRPGSTMDMVLDRDLHYSDDDLRARVQ